MILEGWRDAVLSGRYLAVRYDCSSPSVAHWIARLGRKVGLTGSTFMAVVQTTPEQIAALSPAAATKSPAVETPTPPDETASANHEPIHPERVSVPSPEEAPQPIVPVSAPAQEAETAGAVAQREQFIRELFGIDEEKPRRPWRRH